MESPHHYTRREWLATVGAATGAAALAPHLPLRAARGQADARRVSSS